MAPRKTEAEAKKARLAAALKANLARRKAKTRAEKTQAKPPAK